MASLVGKLVFLAIVLLAVLPAVQLILGRNVFPVELESIVALNFLGWTLLAVGLWWRSELRKLIVHSAQRLGFRENSKLFESQLVEILQAVDTKSQALSSRLLHEPLHSRREVARALEGIVQKGLELLHAESAEIVLFDEGSGTPQSSFLVGRPFRHPATLGAAHESTEVGLNEQPDVIAQNIAFAGSVLGVLRVGLGEGRPPSTFHRDLVGILALQSGLAVINAQYTRELLRMKVASEESIKAKTGFLANLSHEIRGPLGIMTNAVELVLDELCGAVNEEQRETLSMVQTNGKHLLDLVNDVLDYAKIESGQLHVTSIDISISELLHDISAVVRASAQAKSHTVSVEVLSDSLYVRCDRRHLRQILINLLTNAIKYTPDGGKIVLTAARSSHDRLRIGVKDNGVGIETSQHIKVFAPFERVDNSYSKKQVGAGLGLSLTKKLVEANAGLIDFQSEVGKGSEFWVVLPAGRPQELEHQPSEDSQKRKVQGRGETIVLWQGDDVEQHLLERYLLSCEFEVLRAGHVDELQQLSQDGVLKLLVIDNHAADQKKGASLEQLRRSTSAPILLLSSRAFAFDVESYLKRGVDRVLFKPVELYEIATTVRELLDLEKDSQAMRDSTTKGGRQKARGKLIGVDDILH